MKKNLLFTLSFCLFVFVANTQTRLTNNPVVVINAGNSVSCASPAPDYFLTAENSFFHFYDLNNYPSIVDTAFIVRMYLACEETTGGAHVIVGKVHNIAGGFSVANLTLISDDTVAIYPDSSSYKIKMPFTDGYVLPGDSVAAELHVPINPTVSYFVGSNTSPESGLTYFVAPGCGLLNFTTMASISFASMHLIMNVYVNQRPSMAGISSTVFKDDTVHYSSADFTSQFADNDINDGLTRVKVVTTPTSGILDLNGTTLVVGDTIMTNELDMLKYIPNPTYYGMDNFSVRASDTTLWANTPTVCDIFVYNWVLSNPEEFSADLSVYPNPTTSQITVKIDQPIQQIRIINSEGKLISTRITDETTLDVSKLESGNYFVEVKTENGIYLQKFIKQ